MKDLRLHTFLFFRTMLVGLAVTALIFFTACASRPPKYGTQLFGAVGTEADVYVFAPVLGNEQLLRSLFTAFIPEKTALQYLTRTSALYIGLRYDVPSITFSSAGSYPVSLSDLLFSKKDGWEKRRAAVLNNRTYYHSQVADIVLQEKTAFALFGDKARHTEIFLQRIAEPQQPVFPPRFQALIESGESNEIGLYARSGSHAATALFDLQDIELPIRSIELYLKKASDTSYRYSAVFEAVNKKAALVLRILLGNMISGTLSVQDTSIFIENADISEAELIKLLQGIFKTYQL